MNSSAQIDLVKGKTSLMDQFLKWALSFGRLLIIVVEIVAFSAFIYRFVLDRQIIDLNDKIKNEQAIIESSKKQEETYRNLHERLATIKNISTTGNITPKIINDIIAITPAEITYNSYNIGDGKLDMELNVISFSALTSFVKNLRVNPQISSVTITGIDNSSGGNSVKVNISAKIKENKQ
jgi:hypothetical protein